MIPPRGSVTLPQMQKAANRGRLISDCSPAEGPIASFDSTEHRQVPLAGLPVTLPQNGGPV
jgi:hypothetical protein